MSRKCSHCGVKIVDNTEKCPLCNGILEPGEEGEDFYPDIVHKARKMGLVLRILFAGWLTLSVVCGLINYYTYDGVLWSVIISVATFYIVFMLYLLTYTRIGYLGRIFAAVFMGVFLVVSIDEVTGFRGWSIDYVLPGGLLIIDLALIIIRVINRKTGSPICMYSFWWCFWGSYPCF